MVVSVIVVLAGAIAVRRSATTSAREPQMTSA
jgi:hypothetical protein